MEETNSNHMETLCSKLNSLLPQSSSKETSLPDQLDEIVNYIKTLQGRLKKLKEKKNSLLEPISLCQKASSGDATSAGILSPDIIVQEVGSTLDVVCITKSSGSEHLKFNQIVRVLEEEGAEIKNANFSIIGDIVFHSIHSKVEGSAENHRGAVATISKRLKQLLSFVIYG